MRVAENESGLYLQSRQQVGVGFNKLLLTGLAAGLMGILSSSAMYVPSSPPFFRLPATAAIVAIIFLLSGFRIGKFSTWRLLALYFWVGFATVSLISALIHRDSLLPEIWQFVGVPVILFMAFPRTANRYGNIMVLSAMVLAFVPYIAVSLFKYPIFTPYPGVFLNSNMFGMIMSTLSAALFALFRGALNHRKTTFFTILWQAVLGLSLVASFVLIIFSASRTSFITFLLMYLIFVGTLFFDASRHRFLIAMAVTGFVAALAYILYSAASSSSGNMIDAVTNKFLNKMTQGDASGGRLYIWKLVLSDIRLLGMGNNIFFEQPAHNTYMMILATRGPIAVVFMLAVHLTTLILAVQRVFNNIRQDGYAIGPLLVVVNYLILGLAENVFGTLGNGINISYLLMAGILFNSGQSMGKNNLNAKR